MTSDQHDRRTRFWNPEEVRAGRSVLLGALGAAAGLAVAVAALASARGAFTGRVPTDAVAMVNEQPLSRQDFEIVLRSMGVNPATATAAQRKAGLEGMIREELRVQRAKEIEVTAFDEDARLAVVNSVEQSIAADALSGQPSEENLIAYYRQHKDQFSVPGEMTATEIVVPAAAADALRRLRMGENPQKVAAGLHGKVARTTDGNDFYFAARIHLGAALFEKAAAQAAGSASIVSIGPDGTHLLIVVSNKPPVPLPFESVRKDVLGAYRSSSVTRIQEADERYFRKRANVLLASDMK